MASSEIEQQLSDKNFLHFITIQYLLESSNKAEAIKTIILLLNNHNLFNPITEEWVCHHDNPQELLNQLKQLQEKNLLSQKNCQELQKFLRSESQAIENSFDILISQLEYQKAYDQLENTIKSLNKNSGSLNRSYIHLLKEIQKKSNSIYKNNNKTDFNLLTDIINKTNQCSINYNRFIYKNLIKKVYNREYYSYKYIVGDKMFSTGGFIFVIGVMLIVAALSLAALGAPLSPIVFIILAAITTIPSGFLSISGALLRRKAQGLSRSINQFFQFINQTKPEEPSITTNHSNPSTAILS